MEDQNSTESAATQETAATETNTNTQAEKTSKPLIIGIILALVVLAGGYVALQQNAAVSEDPIETAAGQIDPEQLVATVNTVELFGADLNLQIVQAAQSAGLPGLDGADADTQSFLKAQALDALVNTELILQAAQANGIVVSEEDTDAEYQTIVGSIGGEEVAALRLSELGLTPESFKENLVDDIMIRRYIEAVTDESVLAVSDEEVQAFYDQVTEEQTEGIPPLEEARFQIEEQLKFQKQQEALVQHIEQLRVGANIEILI